jgi:DNA-binding GntR family transcriptional regulator
MAEQIATSIRDAIARGTILPGTRLFEVHLAREMGTSRAPVREALGHLEREGWLVKESNRGVRVLDLTEEKLREVASFRGVIEGFAASLAAEQLTANDFEKLESILAEMNHAARQGDYPHLVELDFEFHAFVCRGSRHQTLFEAWNGMAGKIRLYLSATNLMYQHLERISKGHAKVLEGLKSRDKAKACQAMIEHLDEMLEPFIARLVSSQAQAHEQGSRAANRRESNRLEE